MTAKPNTNGPRKKKPSSRRIAKDLTNGTGTRREKQTARRTAQPRKPSKRAKTLEEVTMEAWEYTYRTRDRRLTKP